MNKNVADYVFLMKNEISEKDHSNADTNDAGGRTSATRHTKIVMI